MKIGIPDDKWFFRGMWTLFAISVAMLVRFLYGLLF
jgi:hypothetical protein